MNEYVRSIRVRLVDYVNRRSRLPSWKMPMTQWLTTRRKLKKKDPTKGTGESDIEKETSSTPSSFRGKDGADSAGSFPLWDIEVYLAGLLARSRQDRYLYQESSKFCAFPQRRPLSIPIARDGDRSNNNVPLILDSRASIVHLHSDSDRPIMKGTRSGIFGEIDTRFHLAVLFVKTEESRRLQALYDQPFVPKPIDERRKNQERIESLASAKINNLNRSRLFYLSLERPTHLSFIGPIITRHSALCFLSRIRSWYRWY